MNDSSRIVHVVAGVIRQADHCVLLCQRGDGKDFAGCWEFPGGKIEIAETAEQALKRELAEELGIEVSATKFLRKIVYPYAGFCLHLHVFHVVDWVGTIQAREGQAIDWIAPEALKSLQMPPADYPIATELVLPRIYAISREYAGNLPHYLADIGATLDSGVRLLQLRCGEVAKDQLANIVLEVRQLCQKYDCTLILNNHIEDAQRWDCDGVHLQSSQLAEFAKRPLPQSMWLGASCHNQKELEKALEIGVDFVTLSPLQNTKSHPSANHLGWDKFSDWIEDYPIPVFALGGMRRSDLNQARARGAFGVAGISDFIRSA